jgi:hypothetical protein
LLIGISSTGLSGSVTRTFGFVFICPPRYPLVPLDRLIYRRRPSAQARGPLAPGLGSRLGTSSPRFLPLHPSPRLGPCADCFPHHHWHHRRPPSTSAMRARLACPASGCARSRSARARAARKAATAGAARALADVQCECLLLCYGANLWFSRFRPWLFSNRHFEVKHSGN